MAADSISVISISDLSYNEDATKKEIPLATQDINEGLAVCISVISIKDVASDKQNEENIKEQKPISKDVCNVEEESISIIELHGELNSQENEEGIEEKPNSLTSEDIFKMLIISIGIIAGGALSVVPWTIIPRTNSIVFQSSWLQLCLPWTITWLLSAGCVVINLAILDQRAIHNVIKSIC